MFQAWLTFAVFDNARRARLGHRPRRVPRPDRRAARADDADRGAQSARVVPSRAVGAARSSTATPDNRMVGYPYTKYMVAVMDVDMAGALLLATHGKRRRARDPARPARVPAWVVLRARSGARGRAPRPRELARDGGRERGGAPDRRCRRSTTSPTSISTPASRARCTSRATRSASRRAIRAGVTVTGGLPYHGGPASGYLTHSIAEMVERLRVGSGGDRPRERRRDAHDEARVRRLQRIAGAVEPPDAARVQAAVDRAGSVELVAEHEGEATVGGVLGRARPRRRARVGAARV